MSSKFLVVNNGSQHINSLLQLVSAYGRVTLTGPDNLSHWNEYAAVVLSGSGSQSFIKHRAAYPKVREYIRSTSIPVLGICLGFELIANAYRVRLTSWDKKYQGLQEVKGKSAILDGLGRVMVYEGHRWTVPMSMRSKRLEVLGFSLQGIEIIKVRGKPIYGFQFHPEVHEYEGVKTSGPQLFERFLQFSDII